MNKAVTVMCVNKLKVLFQTKGCQCTDSAHYWSLLLNMKLHVNVGEEQRGFSTDLHYIFSLSYTLLQRWIVL